MTAPLPSSAHQHDCADSETREEQQPRTRNGMKDFPDCAG
jgi:hypothetical protein